MSNTYTELLAEVESWSSRADVASEIPTFIRFAETRFNRDLRVRQMEVSADLTVTGGTREVALPADYLQMRRLYIDGSPVSELEYVSPQTFWQSHGGSETGNPKFFTIEGSNIVLAPNPDTAYTAKFLYYQRIPALLTNETNWLLDEQPDLYLYASLVALAHRTRDDAYLSTVAKMYDEAMAATKKDGALGGTISYQPRVSP